jgi:hypothetical protein
MIYIHINIYKHIYIYIHIHIHIRTHIHIHIHIFKLQSDTSVIYVFSPSVARNTRSWFCPRRPTRVPRWTSAEWWVPCWMRQCDRWLGNDRGESYGLVGKSWINMDKIWINNEKFVVNNRLVWINMWINSCKFYGNLIDII